MVYFRAEQWCTTVRRNGVLQCTAMVYYRAEQLYTTVQSNGVFPCRAMVYFRAEQWCTTVQSNCVLPYRVMVHYRVEQWFTTVLSNGVLPCRAMMYYRADWLLNGIFWLGSLIKVKYTHLSPLGKNDNLDNTPGKILLVLGNRIKWMEIAHSYFCYFNVLLNSRIYAQDAPER